MSRATKRFLWGLHAILYFAHQWGIFLTRSELLVGQNVVGLEGDVMHSQDLADGVGEAAPRGLGHTFHEDDNIS